MGGRRASVAPAALPRFSSWATTLLVALVLTAPPLPAADDDKAAKKAAAVEKVEEKKAAIKRAAGDAAEAAVGAVELLFNGAFFDAPAVQAIVVQEQAVVIGDVDPFVQQVQPFLKVLLSGELHFIRKVCAPTPEQYEKIRKGADAEFQAQVKQFAALVQKQNRGNVEFPDPRKDLAAKLAELIAKVQSPEAAARYRQELEFREEARRKTAIDNIVMRLDRELALSPDQSAKLTAAMTEKFNPQWTKQMCVFLYSEEYSPLPDGKLVLPLLSDSQKKLWNAMPTGYGISFGWQGELNFLGDQFDGFGDEAAE